MFLKSQRKVKKKMKSKGKREGYFRRLCYFRLKGKVQKEVGEKLADGVSRIFFEYKEKAPVIRLVKAERPERG